MDVTVGADVLGRVMSAPAFLPVHLGREVQEELLAEGLGAVGACPDRRVELSADDVVEADVERLPVGQGMRPSAKSARVAGDVAQPSVQL
ncbi:hypothetical protein ABZ721_32955 [Streptomyces sp. NPDC006733]|uniref:hypothetical protein n=1 Tax=Streptomyces sp. NPDC006733 TaxID=3155460 RepID=UPI0033C05731